jgi:alpha,alpha-trehalase
MPDGAILNRYWDDRDAPRDESWRLDVETARSAQGQPIYRDIRAAAESGWDFSSRWFRDGRTLATIRTTTIVPPDLNSLLYGLERAIAAACLHRRDDRCAEEYRRRADRRASAIRKYLWNADTGVFDDFDWNDGRLLGNISAATYFPLFCGVATRKQARRVARRGESELLKSGGIAATNRLTGQQWDAPNGWAPLQWVAVQGLRNYGEDARAKKIATRWLATVSRVYRTTGKLLEKYDVETALPGGGGEYPLQDGFGWTNGVTLGFRRLYPQTSTGRA